MTLSQAIISGVVQGITEFFPVSSSGHLVLLHSVFGIAQPQLAFDIFLHLGTTAAVLIFFWKDILDLFLEKKRELLFILAASIPTFIIAVLFKDAVERFFGMPKVVGWMLIVTGFWIITASLSMICVKKDRGMKPLNILNSVTIGVAQGISVMPGISRSGSTIATGMILGLERESAFRFSFLLSIPAVLGAVIFKLGKIGSSLSGSDAPYFIAGGAVALVTGIFAAKVLLKLIRANLFFLFGIYCLLAGTAVLASPFK